MRCNPPSPIQLSDSGEGRLTRLPSLPPRADGGYPRRRRLRFRNVRLSDAPLPKATTKSTPVSASQPRAEQADQVSNMITLGQMRRFGRQFLDESPLSPKRRRVGISSAKIWPRLNAKSTITMWPRTCRGSQLQRITTDSKVAYLHAKELAGWNVPSTYEELIGAVQIAVVQFSSRIDLFFNWVTTGNWHRAFGELGQGGRSRPVRLSRARPKPKIRLGFVQAECAV
jgi:hypothetical protein